MGKSKEQYRIAEYNEWVLYTDGEQFYAKDDAGNVTDTAKTLDALKARLLKPTQVNVKAIILNDGDRYGDYRDKHKAKHSIVNIYGVSGAGSLLYTRANGEKHKTSRYNNELRLYDETKIKDYDTIMAGLAELEARKEALMDSWNTLQPEDVKGAA